VGLADGVLGERTVGAAEHQVAHAEGGDVGADRHDASGHVGAAGTLLGAAEPGDEPQHPRRHAGDVPVEWVERARLDGEQHAAAPRRAHLAVGGVHHSAGPPAPAAHPTAAAHGLGERATLGHEGDVVGFADGVLGERTVGAAEHQVAHAEGGDVGPSRHHASGNVGPAGPLPGDADPRPAPHHPPPPRA